VSLLTALLSSACLGTPTPLAPQLQGSIGLPHNGVQTQAVELPKSGSGFERFRPFGSAYFGQPALVASLTAAAADMQRRAPGPPLVLGDLSARYGGQIPRHNSHRSGRDVDLLWYLMTPTGKPVKAPGFLHVGADGLAVDPDSGGYLRLDLERQWALIKTLLQDPTIHVQWMFCSRAIEALLIQHARARGEADELVWRAETVMLQPADSLPHDDHIHMRISCTPETMLTGCAGGGPYWEWLPTLSDLLVDDALLQRIGLDDPLPENKAAQGSDPAQPVERG
jgi:penicillin-insensitive murein endopeptidase